MSSVGPETAQQRKEAVELTNSFPETKDLLPSLFVLSSASHDNLQYLSVGQRKGFELLY